MFSWSKTPPVDPSRTYLSREITETIRQSEEANKIQETQDVLAKFLQKRYTDQLGVTDDRKASISTLLEPPELTDLTRASHESPIIITPYNQRLPNWRSKRDDDVDNSERWKNRIEFVSAGLTFTIGLRGITSIVSETMHYGGSYIYAYLIVTGLMGIPLYFFEVALGQFTAKGPAQLFALVPLFQGIGYSLITNAILESTLYTARVSIVAYYFFATFNFSLKPLTWKLPWEIPANLSNVSICHVNMTAGSKYLLETVLGYEPGKTSGIGVNWKLLVCLALTCTLVYFAVLKCTKVVGKVLSISILIIICFLAVMTITFLSQPGAINGVLYMFNPRWESFGDATMWSIATDQVIYTLGLGNGVVIFIGSYSRFQSPSHIDSLTICLVTTGLYLIFGVFVFSGYGALCHFEKSTTTFKPARMRREFLIHAESILSILPFPPLWSMMYFLMLFLIGVTSIFMFCMIFTRIFYLYRPSLRNNACLVAFFVVGMQFLCSILFISRVSNNADTLVGAVSFPTKLIVAFELVAFVFCYGLMRLRGDLMFMLQFDPNRYYRYSWIASPFVLIFLKFYNLCTNNFEELKPKWALYLTIAFAYMVLLPIPVVAIYKAIAFYRQGVLRNILRPPEETSQTVQDPVVHSRHTDCLHAFFRRRSRRVSSEDSSVSPSDFDWRCCGKFTSGPSNMLSKVERINTKSTLDVANTTDDTKLTRNDGQGHDLSVLSLTNTSDLPSPSPSAKYTRRQSMMTHFRRNNEGGSCLKPRTTSVTSNAGQNYYHRGSTCVPSSTPPVRGKQNTPRTSRIVEIDNFDLPELVTEKFNSMKDSDSVSGENDTIISIDTESRTSSPTPRERRRSRLQ